MRTNKQIVMADLLALMTLLSLQPLASAVPSSSGGDRAEQALSAIKTIPYTLTLSINSLNGFGNPYFTLDLANATRHTLVFRWDNPRDAAFEVEYRPATDDLRRDGGWQRLAPNAQPPADKADPHGPTIVSYNVRFEILPGQQDSGLVFSPDFPMSRLGFYRVRAILTLADASELDGPRDAPTARRDVHLVIRSEPFVISHTKAGYTPVDAVAGK